MAWGYFWIYLIWVTEYLTKYLFPTARAQLWRIATEGWSDSTLAIHYEVRLRFKRLIWICVCRCGCGLAYMLDCEKITLILLIYNVWIHWKINNFLLEFLRRVHGFKGLFKGLEAKILQTVLTAALMFVCYEKIASIVFAILMGNRKMAVKK